MLIKTKDKSRIIFLKQNLTEEEAFKHEIYMIAVFGRKDLGGDKTSTNGTFTVIFPVNDAPNAIIRIA